MKIHFELNCETLNEVRAELANFLGPDTAVSAPTQASVMSPATAQAPAVAETATATAPTGTAQTSRARKPQERPIETRSHDPVGTVAANPSAADVALGVTTAGVVGRSAPTSAKQARSAADVALGLEIDDETDTTAENEDGKVSGDSRQPDAEQLLADKAQLNFDFDRVLALQGRAAALGIVRGVLPPGQQTKLKDLEMLPVELIPAAIAALRTAGAN